MGVNRDRTKLVPVIAGLTALILSAIGMSLDSKRFLYGLLSIPLSVISPFASDSNPAVQEFLSIAETSYYFDISFMCGSIESILILVVLIWTTTDGSSKKT